MDFVNSQVIFKEMDLVAEVGSEIDKIEDNNNQIEDVENMVEYNNDFQYVSDTVLKLVRDGFSNWCWEDGAWERTLIGATHGQSNYEFKASIWKFIL